jgi:putative ABC transport system permease protein
VIVNESFARRYFPGESALGKRFFVVDKGNELVAQEVVGLVGDTKYLTVRDATSPTIYGLLPPVDRATIQVRTDLEPRALVSRLLAELPRAHPALRMTGVTTQSTLIDNTLVRERLLALLSGFLSSVAIVLVTVGLYGVLSYGVAQRTREIGIRVALGARPLGIAGMVVSETGLVTLVGLVLGLAGGVVASRFTTAFLYDVQPSDLSSIATPLLTLLVVCSLSAVRPALRAARVDPTTTLRCD